MSDDERPQTETPMTDTTDDEIEPADETEPAGETESADDRSDLRRTLNYVLLGGLSLLALIATLQLYLNVSSAINQWITYEYRSLFQAAFNLTVLLLVGAAMVWQGRQLRLRGRQPPTGDHRQPAEHRRRDGVEP